ncbi:hypothetical protein JCM3765_005894, partial [Sporobolomyces pararoseus]
MSSSSESEPESKEAPQVICNPRSLELPNDVWTRILKSLEYKDLKKASRICKHLQKIIAGKDFDAALFRAGPAKPQLVEGERLKIHPMLEKTDCVFKDWESAEILHQGVGEKDYKVYFPKDYPSILDEYATSPASSLVILHMNGGPPSKPFSRKKGVKVIDVLKWLGKYWTPVNFDRTLGDHRFFEGWEM